MKRQVNPQPSPRISSARSPLSTRAELWDCKYFPALKWIILNVSSIRLTWEKLEREVAFSI